MQIKELRGKLVIIDFNEFEAYRVASKIEEDGIGFYKKLHEFINNHGVKETLVFLLNEEKKHLLFFQNCLARLRDKGMDTSEDNDLLTSMDYGIFDINLKIESSKNFIKGIKEAIDIGILIEERSIKFYEACLHAITLDNTKKELKNIISEERKHRDLLVGMKP